MANGIGQGQKEEDSANHQKRVFLAPGDPVEIPPDLAEVDMKAQRSEIACRDRTQKYIEKAEKLYYRFDQIANKSPEQYRRP